MRRVLGEHEMLIITRLGGHCGVRGRIENQISMMILGWRRDLRTSEWGFWCEQCATSVRLEKSQSEP